MKPAGRVSVRSTHSAVLAAALLPALAAMLPLFATTPAAMGPALVEDRVWRDCAAR